MIDCKLTFEENIIYSECFNKDGFKNLKLEIFEMDNNLRLIDYNFDMIDYIKIWSNVNYNPLHYGANGFKIKITNLENNQIEFNDVLFLKPFMKTKFIDKNNILTKEITEIMNSNLLETFRNLKDDKLDLKYSKWLIDLGSSIGIFTAYAMEQNPNIKSICVEMVPNFHKICVDTFENNPNIIPINAAVYKESNEEINMNSNIDNFYNLGNTIIENLYGNDQPYKKKVNTISLEDIINKYNIDEVSILKIDIEGYEYELLEKLDSTILNKIDKIYLDFHKVDNNHRKMNVIQKLKDNGFIIDNENIDYVNMERFTLFFIKK